MILRFVMATTPCGGVRSTSISATHFIFSLSLCKNKSNRHQGHQAKYMLLFLFFSFMG